ncbi:RagB/SusD family nutrient uptake outer membrane protein [Hymenobacter ruber]
MNQKFTRTLGMLALGAMLLPVASCNKDLDQIPSYSANAEVVYKTAASAEQVLARLYATFAVSGQTGPAGSPDISGIDEGFSNYLRQYWQLQEITTDEAILGWNDGNLIFVNTLQWNADNEFVRATYDRIFYEIGLCNEFIRQTTDARLSERGVTESDAKLIRQYRAEARLLRALSYWHAIDLFGGGPFTDENSALGVNPPYYTRQQLFTYVENELKNLDKGKVLLNPRQVYGRADRAMRWTLQSKLYLNAKVYTNTDRSADAVVYADSVINAGYTLTPTYANLFLADNNTTGANEIIFPITFDGLRTKTYGGMTYLVHAAVGRAVSASSAGINGGWAGLRAKPQLTSIINNTGATDSRKDMVFTRGQNPNVDTIGVFSSGPLITKYRNVTSGGKPGSDTVGDFPDTDFPMFRLADVLLIKAEGLLRKASPDKATALTLINQVRARATGNLTSHTNDLPALTGDGLDDVFNERTRELFWEGQRRTDLIRFGKFTSNYNWPFKGGVKAGADVPATRALFPLPTTDLVANPNLAGHQNPGY